MIMFKDLRKTARRRTAPFTQIFVTAFALVLALGLAAFDVPAFAAEEIDLTKKGSVTVTTEKNRTFTLYRTAAVNTNGGYSWQLTEDFAGSGADLTDLTADGLADSLAEYAENQGFTGESKEADADGTLIFNNLDLGLYLLVPADTGDTVIEPFLVSVPMKSTDGSGWLYDVDASPKITPREYTDVSVKKVWQDASSKKKRPVSVTVTLYKGSKKIDTIKLSKSNNWKYTWTGLEKAKYSVKETAVSGYTASYTQDGYSFTITNSVKTTGSGGSGGSGGSSSSKKLAQTGQLNWPIPVLAGCGILLFLIGWGMVFLKKKDQ